MNWYSPCSHTTTLGFYKQIVTEFPASSEVSVVIVGTDRSRLPWYRGCESAQSGGANGISVIQRAQDVYLVRTEMREGRSEGAPL